MKLVALFAAVLAAGAIGTAAIASGGTPPTTPSPEPSGAVGDIPGDLVGVYVAAAGSCPGLPWTVLAAIGSVESHHGDGRTNPATGDVQPPIIGPALDGRSGFARIPDLASRDGWAHAQGPMQFLPSTWKEWGRTSPGRPTGATASPNNTWDAIWTAAVYLCDPDRRVTDIPAAVATYNHSSAYVDKVLATAARYQTIVAAPPTASGEMVCPVTTPVRHSNDWHAPRSGGRTHQGNDVFAPHGTILVAIETGTIDKATDIETGLGGITLWLRGDSGTRWYYAHNARNLVTVGTRVTRGQPVAILGNTGNARTTSPHLHIEMHSAGGPAANPYPVIEALCQRTT